MANEILKTANQQMDPNVTELTATIEDLRSSVSVVIANLEAKINKLEE